MFVDRGSIAYSAVTQPSPEPLRQRGTPSVTDAAHSTRVAPNSTRTEPSAWSSQLAGDPHRTELVGRSAVGTCHARKAIFRITTSRTRPDLAAVTGPPKCRPAAPATAAARWPHGGTWVTTSWPTPAAIACWPASRPVRCMPGGWSSPSRNAASQTNTSAPEARSHQRRGRRRVAGVGDRRGRRARPGARRPVPDGRRAVGANLERADVEAAVRVRAGSRTSRPFPVLEHRPYAVAIRSAVPAGPQTGIGGPPAVGPVAPGDVETAQVEAVIGVQMAEQHSVDVGEVGMALQYAERAVAEVEQEPSAVGLDQVDDAGESGPGSDPEQPRTVSLTAGRPRRLRPPGRGTVGPARRTDAGPRWLGTRASGAGRSSSRISPFGQHPVDVLWRLLGAAHQRHRRRP